MTTNNYKKKRTKDRKRQQTQRWRERKGLIIKAEARGVEIEMIKKMWIHMKL